MRWYLVVEGARTEKKIYFAWIEHAFPGAQRALRIEDMAQQRYYLVAGNGYPGYLKRILNAVADIAATPSRFDQLMVCVDAEELPVHERRSEIVDVIAETGCPVPYTVVVHDCCIETWLLGNKKLARVNPQGELLRRYYGFYNIRELDPELLPSMDEGETRARFHHSYLIERWRELGGQL